MDKRSKIIEAAAVCFLRKGFAETSLDEIVSQSGVVKQTLYNNFENKDALFRDAIQQLLTQTQPHFEPELYELAPVEFFQKIAKLLLGTLEDEKTTSFLRLLVKECRRFPELQQLYAESIPLPFVSFVAGYIEQFHSRRSASAEEASSMSAETSFATGQSRRLTYQAIAWYFRASLTGYATLNNLAPFLKFALPTKSKYVNCLAQYFESFLNTGINPMLDAGLQMPEENDSLCRGPESLREFLATQLAALGEKKLAIIEAAIRVFSDKGFADASMDEIAIVSGVSKQTVYKHFRSKQLLYTFIAKCIIDELQNRHFSADLPPKQFIKAFYKNLRELTDAPWLREFFRVVFGESQLFPMESAGFLLFLMQHDHELIERKLAEGQGKATDARTDSLSLSIALRSIVGGSVLLRQIFVVGETSYLSEARLACFFGTIIQG